ncbi:hypothetical protein BDW66DRAFT_137458 [Aspergillus desertorum]
MNPWDSPPKWSLPLSSKAASAANSEMSKTAASTAKNDTKPKAENRTKQQANNAESKAPKTNPLPAGTTPVRKGLVTVMLIFITNS